jgi:hypothetical protein
MYSLFFMFISVCILSLAMILKRMYRIIWMLNLNKHQTFETALTCKY